MIFNEFLSFISTFCFSLSPSHWNITSYLFTFESLFLLLSLLVFFFECVLFFVCATSISFLMLDSKWQKDCFISCLIHKISVINAILMLMLYAQHLSHASFLIWRNNMWEYACIRHSFIEIRGVFFFSCVRIIRFTIDLCIFATLSMFDGCVIRVKIFKKNAQIKCFFCILYMQAHFE